MKVLVTQSCPTLCNPMDCSPPGFSIHGILQARILEWVAISFSRGTSWPRDWTCDFWGQVTKGNYYELKCVLLSSLSNSCVGILTHSTSEMWHYLEITSLQMSFIKVRYFPGGSDGKASAYNEGDPGLIPGLGRSPGEGNGNPLQYSCLGNPIDRGAW